MIAVGVGVLFSAYTLGIWGYCLVKSYNVPFPALFHATWPGAPVNMTAPSGGRKLGTITNSTEVTDPGQLRAQQGQ